MSPESSSLRQSEQPNLPQEGRGREKQAWEGQGRQVEPGTLTAVGLISVVFTVRVAIAAPQLEDTVPISTGELVGLTGRSGAWVDQAGFSQRPSQGQHPHLQSCPVLTTVQLITAILAVLLPITDIVFGNAVPAAARGLMGPTGPRSACAGEQRLGSGGVR